MSTNNSDRAWSALEQAVSVYMKEQRRQRQWSLITKAGTLLLFAALFLVNNPGKFIGTIFGEPPHTAVVRMDGEISDGSRAGADMVVAGLRRAFEAEESRAVILMINSPGGSPVQAGYIYDEIRRLRALYPEKKIYSVIRDIGASGAYYAAAATDEIYADKASIVGSIGVISTGFGFDKFLEKVGVERRVFRSGSNKSFLDPYSPLQGEQVGKWEALLSHTHKQFIDAVVTGRQGRLKDDKELFSGLMWNGQQAVELGLIDHLGNASFVARDIVHAEEIVDYSVRPSPFAELPQRIGASFGEGVMEAIKSSFPHFGSASATM